MLDEFRALGGVANNVGLGYGPFGRGLFPIDPSKPVTIRIPDNLLVQIEHVVFENLVFRVSPASGLDARARGFIERYEQDFSWGTTCIETERFLAMMNALPEALREMLTTQLGLGNFFEPPSPQLTASMFFASRAITASGGRRVIMPIIELANHGPGTRYDTRWGVSLHGQFDGEVLVRYTVPADPYDLFTYWMFAPQEPMAFSVKMKLTVGGKEIWIDREFNEEQAPWVPKVSVEGNRISLSYLLLGHRQFPRLPRGSFQRAMSDAGVEKPGEIFEIIQHVNRERFLDLLDALEPLDVPEVQPLRTLVRNQLRALSCYYGLRPV